MNIGSHTEMHTRLHTEAFSLNLLTYVYFKMCYLSLLMNTV